jgi:hypothetical protein
MILQMGIIKKRKKEIRLCGILDKERRYYLETLTTGCRGFRGPCTSHNTPTGAEGHVPG